MINTILISQKAVFIIEVNNPHNFIIMNKV